MADRLSDTPISAKNVMIFHGSLFQSQFTPPQDLAQLKEYHRLRREAQNVGHDADAEKNEEDGKNTSRFRNGSYLTEPHGSDADNRHVQGVQHTPLFDCHVTNGSETENGNKEAYSFCHISGAQM
ncbi:MAG: hypothetical protein P8Y91_05945 [Desulfuromonadales bacterium]